MSASQNHCSWAVSPVSFVSPAVETAIFLSSQECVYEWDVVVCVAGELQPLLSERKVLNFVLCITQPLCTQTKRQPSGSRRQWMRRVCCWLSTTGGWRPSWRTGGSWHACSSSTPRTRRTCWARRRRSWRWVLMAVSWLPHQTLPLGPSSVFFSGEMILGVSFTFGVKQEYECCVKSLEKTNLFWCSV